MSRTADALKQWARERGVKLGPSGTNANYIPCPVCEGQRQLSKRRSNGAEYHVNCPHCTGTGRIRV